MDMTINNQNIYIEKVNKWYSGDVQTLSEKLDNDCYPSEITNRKKRINTDKMAV